MEWYPTNHIYIYTVDHNIIYNIIYNISIIDSSFFCQKNTVITGESQVIFLGIPTFLEVLSKICWSRMALGRRDIAWWWNHWMFDDFKVIPWDINGNLWSLNGISIWNFWSLNGISIWNLWSLNGIRYNHNGIYPPVSSASWLENLPWTSWSFPAN